MMVSNECRSTSRNRRIRSKRRNTFTLAAVASWLISDSIRRVASILSSVSSAGAYCRSISTISIGVGAPAASLLDRRGHLVEIVPALPDGVGADLPDGQDRRLRDHVRPHARQFLGRLLADNPPVEHVDHAVLEFVATTTRAPRA